MRGLLQLPALYPILDASKGAGGGGANALGLSSTGALGLLDALLEAGVPWLQLRAKALPAGEFVALAREVVARASRAGARVIVNDRLDVALASGAAGVHVGQEDLPVEAVRAIAGDRLVVGLSTHSVAEAREAEAAGADYVGFGPMRPTASKADTRPPRSLEELRAVSEAVRIPIVAIGGIDEAIAADVLAAGATSVAMIGALARSPEPGALARRLLGRSR